MEFLSPRVDHIISINTSDTCTRNPLTPITIHALPLDTGNRRRVELSIVHIFMEVITKQEI
jgi:hypothetical protein